jgi:uncharacterized protein HemY
VAALVAALVATLVAALVASLEVALVAALVEEELSSRRQETSLTAVLVEVALAVLVWSGWPVSPMPPF